MGVIATGPLAVAKVWVWSAAHVGKERAGTASATVNNSAVAVFSMFVSYFRGSAGSGADRFRSKSSSMAPHLFIGWRAAYPSLRQGKGREAGLSGPGRVGGFNLMG